MYPRCPLLIEFFLAKFSKRGAVQRERACVWPCHFMPSLKEKNQSSNDTMAKQLVNYYSTYNGVPGAKTITAHTSAYQL